MWLAAEVKWCARSTANAAEVLQRTGKPSAKLQATSLNLTIKKSSLIFLYILIENVFTYWRKYPRHLVKKIQNRIHTKQVSETEQVSEQRIV